MRDLEGPAPINGSAIPESTHVRLPGLWLDSTSQRQLHGCLTSAAARASELRRTLGFV